MKGWEAGFPQDVGIDQRFVFFGGKRAEDGSKTRKVDKIYIIFFEIMELNATINIPTSSAVLYK